MRGRFVWAVLVVQRAICYDEIDLCWQATGTGRGIKTYEDKLFMSSSSEVKPNPDVGSRRERYLSSQDGKPNSMRRWHSLTPPERSRGQIDITGVPRATVELPSYWVWITIAQLRGLPNGGRFCGNE